MLIIERIREQVENVLYPELRPYGRADRDRLLKKASETPLDSVEWTGILAGLVFVVALTRYGIAEFGLVHRIAVALVNFCAAILLLGVTCRTAARPPHATRLACAAALDKNLLRPTIGAARRWVSFGVPPSQLIRDEPCESLALCADMPGTAGSVSIRCQ